MRILRWIVGIPHEGLHILALLLIGKRPVGASFTHVDAPPGLTPGQLRFVALFPATVFLGVAALGLVLAVQAPSPTALLLGCLLGVYGITGLASTVGDWQIVMGR